MYAFRDAIERHVDFATVNDRFFVNNVSLGVYAKIGKRSRTATPSSTRRTKRSAYGVDAGCLADALLFDGAERVVVEL